MGGHLRISHSSQVWITSHKNRLSWNKAPHVSELLCTWSPPFSTMLWHRPGNTRTLMPCCLDSFDNRIFSQINLFASEVSSLMHFAQVMQNGPRWMPSTFLPPVAPPAGQRVAKYDSSQWLFQSSCPFYLVPSLDKPRMSWVVPWISCLCALASLFV